MPRKLTVRSALFLCLGMAVLPCCRSTNQLLKARPAQLSPFIEHPAEMVDPRKVLPFQKLWKAPDAELWARIETKKTIYVAPVTLDYLRPVKKHLARGEVALGSIKRREKEMSSRLRDAFREAFQDAPNPRFHLVEQPGADSVTLRLALVELNPTSPTGNVVKTGLGFVVGPFSQLGSLFTKGNIAIEGKVQNSATGELCLEFAENEGDRMTLYSLRDFQAYGHATHAIRAWAKQFEQYTRNPPGKVMRDTAFFTLNPL